MSYLGCETIRCQPGVLQGASSTAYVDKNDPPMLLIHGIEDELVPYRQSVQMADMLENAGVSAELMLIPEAGHGFIGGAREQTREASLKALRATFDFIDKILYSDK